MATYLVTGAAGFIGSNLVRALLERGETVRGIDNFATGRRENLEGVDGLEFIEGDITVQSDIERAVDGVDYVLHQAAIPSVPRSVKDPVASHHANVTGTLMVLDAARKADVKRLVYAASSSAYGDTPVLPKQEDMPTNPKSPYAVAKLAGENYARAYSEVFGLSTVALRYFNVFGPRQDPTSTYAAVIPNFIRAALTDTEARVDGDGLQTRDFTYIANVVEANLLAATAEAPARGVYNIACGERTSLLDLIESLSAIVGRRVEVRHAPPRAGDVRDSLADISRARAELGYSPATSIREGLRMTVDWYASHMRTAR